MKKFIQNKRTIFEDKNKVLNLNQLEFSSKNDYFKY